MSITTSLSAQAKELFIKTLRKIAATSDMLPAVRYHVSDTVVSFQDSYLMSIIELEGAAYEALDDALLEMMFDNHNKTYNETSQQYAGRVQFQGYQLRRKIENTDEYNFDNLFCQEFADKYQKRFNEKDYFENRFFMAITMKYDETIEQAIEELHGLVNDVCKKNMAHNPTILTAYKNKHGVLASEVFELLFELINNEAPVGCVPLTGTPAFDALPSSSLHFGYEVMQSRGVHKNRYATFLDLKDFPNVTKLGLLNQATLGLPFEYNLIHSLTPLAPAKALHRINDQMNRLRSTNDKAEHQTNELLEAQGYIQSGELSFGDFYSTMVIYGNTAKEAIENRVTAIANLSNYAGAIYRAAQLSAPASFFSQFPLYPNAPRKMLKSTRNFAGLFSLHNYSRGKAKGNPLGDGSSIMQLETLGKNLYDFNFHFTNPEEDTIGEAIAGHTLILGATGTGKTTLQSSLVTYLQRFNPAMFVLDKDRGMDIFIRALDGDYFALEEGKPTGINPFQFEDSPKLREFLNELVITLATDANNYCSSEEQNQIKVAIDAVMELPKSLRRLAGLLQVIPDRGGNSLYQRLLKWVSVEEGVGRFAWVLDNPTNQFNPNSFKIVGFDVGEILKEDYLPTEPILACLLYMKSQMTKNHDLLCTIVEEFWLPLKYKTPQEMILDVLKTGRKRGEFMLLVTQSPEEAVQSPIFPAIVQQTSTKILLPNPAAEYKNEQGGGYSRVGLTEKEFIRLRDLDNNSRTFLIKQGHQSSFAVLDLYGFSDEIAVLSGTKTNVQILDEILSRYQERPSSNEWLHTFYKAVKLKKGEVTTLAKLVDDAFIAVGKPEYAKSVPTMH
ncbi:hypothetical protein B0181_11140 [Moraxella caviae]|uniref:Pertussis toxin liberation protein C n=1 Tax=Moraxella caviae TaxID=34060 RepID=A0A1S9ZUD4_9GAMM|nr:hypothetical protein [Moraxella caviae]OOR87122.1 hypothetical protein B0181_11140 [Moraxella caviae]STZ13654.1 Pertussis toxin liberation protein C [Moraxella caviae]VEW10154.1 Pertussis toxin liberation protein C [Moraxella caviae]